MEKVIYVNRSNGSKEATINERVKFALIQAVGEIDLMAIFGDGKELEEAEHHFAKHLDAVSTKFAKSSDIVKAIVRTEYTIVE